MCFGKSTPIVESLNYLIQHGESEDEPFVKEITKMNNNIKRIHILLRMFVVVHLGCLLLFLLLALAVLPFAAGYISRIDTNSADINNFYNTEVKPMVKNAHAIINRTHYTLEGLGIDPFEEFVDAVNFIRSENVTNIANNVEDMMWEMYKNLVKPTSTRKLFTRHIIDAFVSLVPALRSAVANTLIPKASWIYDSALIQNCSVTLIGNYGLSNEERNVEMFEDMLYIDEIYYWLYYNLDYAQSLSDSGKLDYMTGSPTNKWGELKDFKAYNYGSGVHILRAEFSNNGMLPLESYKSVGVEVAFPDKDAYDKFLAAAKDRTIT